MQHPTLTLTEDIQIQLTHYPILCKSTNGAVPLQPLHKHEDNDTGNWCCEGVNSRLIIVSRLVTLLSVGIPLVSFRNVKESWEGSGCSCSIVKELSSRKWQNEPPILRKGKLKDDMNQNTADYCAESSKWTWLLSVEASEKRHDD